ncbi:MAG TPA: FkbM family methyltransferase [Mariprofundaceae bacterium]|nr:FkbM family methyltransferase [Mariprofundaceae bacterium]
MAPQAIMRRLLLWLLRHLPLPPELSSSLQGRALPASEGLVPYVNGDGIRFELDLHEYIQKRIYAYQYYEPECVRAARRFMRQGGIVVDIGANIGQYSLLAAVRVGPAGRVLAFEPSPPILERLRRHLAINRVDNVEVVPCAVSDVAGTLSYYGPAQAGNLGQGSLVAPSDADGTRSHEALPVQAVRLDAELAARGIDTVDFVKIDVEGHEMAVLRSAEPWLRERRIRVLMVEISPDNLRQAGQDHEAVIGYLQGFDYRPMVAHWSGRLRPLQGAVLADTNVFFLASGGGS